MRRTTQIGLLLAGSVLYLGGVICVCRLVHRGHEEAAQQPGEPAVVELAEAEVTPTAQLQPPSEPAAEHIITSIRVTSDSRARFAEPGRCEPCQTALPPCAEVPPAPSPTPQQPPPMVRLGEPIPPTPDYPEGWQREVRVVHRPSDEGVIPAEPPAPVPQPVVPTPSPMPPVGATPTEGADAPALWRAALEVEQAGDLARAKQLLRELARQTADHNLTIRCYNRIRAIDERLNASSASGGAAWSGETRLVPRPASANPVLARPAHPTKTGTARKTTPLTGTHPCTLDDKHALTLPGRVREQLGEPLPRTLFVTAGPDGCLWLFTPHGLEQMADQLDRAPANSSAAQVFRRLYFAHTESSRVDRTGTIIVPEPLAQFAGLGREVVLIGVRDHFELWDAQRWQQYLEQHVPVTRAARKASVAPGGRLETTGPEPREPSRSPAPSP